MFYVRAMSPPEPLSPAAPEEIADAIAFALRYSGRKRVNITSEMMAAIVAKRLVEHLARSGFVVMKRPPLSGSAPLAPPAPHPGRASMTPEQCKQARGLLNWSRADLAEAAELPVLVVEMFEADELVGLPSCEIAMRDVFSAAGIGFPELDAHSRRAPNSVTFAPPPTPYVIRRRKAPDAPTTPLGLLAARVRRLYERALGPARDRD